MRQPVTNGLALLAHWSVCQKLDRISSVQLSYVALSVTLGSVSAGGLGWSQSESE